MQLRRPLGDRDEAKTKCAAAPSDSVDLAERARHIACRLLRSEDVCLLQHKPERGSVDSKEVVEQVSHEPSLLWLAHLAQVKYGGNRRAG
jgi:hypothetical protein